MQATRQSSLFFLGGLTTMGMFSAWLLSADAGLDPLAFSEVTMATNYGPKERVRRGFSNRERCGASHAQAGDTISRKSFVEAASYLISDFSRVRALCLVAHLGRHRVLYTVSSTYRHPLKGTRCDCACLRVTPAELT